MTKNYLRYLVATAFVAASGASNVAFAVEETSAPNDSLVTAQRLVITNPGPDGKGSVEVIGALGLVMKGGTPIDDVDFYSFEARAGDRVTIDIDFGMKESLSELRSVDTVVGIFYPNGELMRQVDDAKVIDPDRTSRSLKDPFMPDVALNQDGVYTVGVIASPRKFFHYGLLTPPVFGSSTNGRYTLVISGVTPTPQVQHINIDIKPGADSYASINPKAKGSIPVALLSSEKFDALQVDRSSVTFGPNGTETKALRCGKGGEDVNGDGRLDLVCHFDNQEANFDPSDEEGIVKGKLLAPSTQSLAASATAPRAFEGRGDLKVIAVKRPEPE